MLIRYQTQDGKNHEQIFVGNPNISLFAELGNAECFLEAKGSQLKGATIYMDGRPQRSYAYTPEKGLHQTNP